MLKVSRRALNVYLYDQKMKDYLNSVDALSRIFSIMLAIVCIVTIPLDWIIGYVISLITYPIVRREVKFTNYVSTTNRGLLLAVSAEFWSNLDILTYGSFESIGERAFYAVLDYDEFMNELT